MHKIFHPVIVITSLLAVPLTVVTLLYNIPPAIAGAGYILLLMCAYVFDRRTMNIIVAGTINFILLLVVLFVGFSLHTDFLLFRWIAEITAYLCVASLLLFLSRRVRDLKNLQVSEERLEIALDAITAGLWDWNVADGDKRWWSPRHFELLGYKNNEIKPSNETLKQLIHPDDVEMAYKIMGEHLVKKGRFEIELRYKTKSGQYKWFLAAGLTKFDENNKPVRMVGSIIDIDEKKKALDTIAQQAALIQIMPDAIVYGDKDLRVTSMNKEAEQMLGISLEQARGRSIDEVVRIDVLDSTREEVKNALWEGRGFWRGEALFTTVNGKKISVLATLKTVKNPSNNEAGWIGIYTDITSLKTTEERLELALDGMIAGLWEWKIAEGDKRWWSPRYFELLGYQNNEITPSAKSLKMLIHPDDYDRTFQTMAEHIQKNTRFEMETRYKTKSGSYRWFLVTGQPKLNHDGKAIRIVGSIVDIDEKKKTQQIVQQQAALIQLMPDGIVYADKNRNVISINKGAEDLLEVSGSEIKGKCLDDYISVKSLGAPNDVVRKELWQKGFWRGEVEAINWKGKKATVLTTVKILENMAGTEPGWVCIYTDISLLRLNDELKQALRKLEVTNQYLEQLAYISAHDIKSPIITLDGLVDIMIRSNAVKEEYAEMLNMVKNSTQQMQRTNNSLNNILKLRKTLSTADNEGNETAPLKTIIGDVMSTLQTDIEASQAQITCDLDTLTGFELPYIHFKSIFYNLVSNAIKYRDPSRIPLITIKAQRSPEGETTFTIEDNGLGIDMNRYREKLFGIFKRFHDHVEGTGIGLHMVKSIVEAYGGTIGVDSEPGKGTRFTIAFKALKIK
jgi:PAS domain S-box-containing protein